MSLKQRLKLPESYSHTSEMFQCQHCFFQMFLLITTTLSTEINGLNWDNLQSKIFVGLQDLFKRFKISSTSWDKFSHGFPQLDLGTFGLCANVDGHLSMSPFICPNLWVHM